MSMNLLQILLPLLLNSQPQQAANQEAPNSEMALLKLLLGSLGNSNNNDLAQTVTLNNVIPAPTAAANNATAIASIKLPEEKADTAAVIKAEIKKKEALPGGIQTHIRLLEDYILKHIGKSDTRDAVMKAVADIKQGTRLDDAINPLDDKSKTMLANTIAGMKIEPPEILNNYVSAPLKKYTESTVVDCALKNVEKYYSGLDSGLSSAQAFAATEDHTRWNFK